MTKILTPLRIVKERPSRLDEISDEKSHPDVSHLHIAGSVPVHRIKPWKRNITSDELQSKSMCDDSMRKNRNGHHLRCKRKAMSRSKPKKLPVALPTRRIMHEPHYG